MANEFPKNSIHIEATPEELENGQVGKNLDDDGRERRTGTLLTASAHIVTAVIGSGVLSLAWGLAQLGWVAGPVVLFVFSFITYFTCTLLADCYRSPGPVHGRRNYTYMDVVRSHLGGRKVQLCGVAQFGNLVGVTIGYTITASISMVAIEKSNCYHREGHDSRCYVSNYPYMVIFAVIQIILSQIPNFHNLSWLSILAAVMSFAYSAIGLGLSIARVVEGKHPRTSVTGTRVGEDTTESEKIWKSLQAIGDMAFAYGFATVLIEIQDTLKSPPPENKVMKKASFVGVATTTMFYILCGCMGYAAFGNKAPGNFLTGFGFYEPYWLVDFANVCIAVHLIGAYQVFVQPIYNTVENSCNRKWPGNKFITKDHAIKIPLCRDSYNLNLFRLVWRTVYVVVTAFIAMIFPFFNDFLGLIGAAAFYPLTVYFPIEMHIAQAKIPKYSFRWIWLKILTWACLLVSLVAAAGSIRGLIHDVRRYKPFKTQSTE